MEQLRSLTKDFAMKLYTVRISETALIIVAFIGSARHVLLDSGTRRARRFDNRSKAGGVIWKLDNTGLNPREWTPAMDDSSYQSRLSQLRAESGYAPF